MFSSVSLSLSLVSSCFLHSREAAGPRSAGCVLLGASFGLFGLCVDLALVIGRIFRHLNGQKDGRNGQDAIEEGSLAPRCERVCVLQGRRIGALATLPVSGSDRAEAQ